MVLRRCVHGGRPRREPPAWGAMIAAMTCSGTQLPSDASGRIMLDLRVAVTGHRALSDMQAAARAVNSALDMLEDRLLAGARANSRLVAVSALAEGADRLVANCVLERPNGQLEVVLPMPEVDYLKDFNSTGSIAEFKRLLSEASWVATVPASQTRDEGYAAAGKAVVDRADLTIAIWDGYDSGREGGTAEIVDYVRQRHRPLIWLPTSRAEPVVENCVGPTDIEWLGELTADDLSRLEEFNDPLMSAELPMELIRSFKEQILRKAGDVGVSGSLMDLLDWIQPSLARAEWLSRRFQLLYLRLSDGLFALAASAVCIVGLQLAFFPDIRLIVTGEVTCLLAIVGGLEWGRRRHVQQRWTATRYLAERLRNAFFLTLAGADERPSKISILTDDLGARWAQIAFRMIWLKRPPQWNSGRIRVVPLRRFLAEAWIDDQRRYFEQAARRDLRRHRISARAVEGLFGFSVIVAIIHVALGGPENWLHRLITLLSISIPAFAAALAGHNAQREYLRHAQRYERMAGLLADAANRMRGSLNHAHLRAVAATVDRMLRVERGDWFGTVGLHDLELPT